MDVSERWCEQGQGQGWSHGGSQGGGHFERGQKHVERVTEDGGFGGEKLLVGGDW